METENKFASCLGWIGILVFTITLGLVMNGWALSTIWNWFIPPIFKLTTLTLWQAVGVSMVFELFTGTNKTTKPSGKGETTEERLIESVVSTTLVPLLSVFFAYIVLQFAF